MKVNKIAIELFSLAILSGSLVACSPKATTKSVTPVSKTENVSAVNSNIKTKEELFDDDDYTVNFDDSGAIKLNLSDLSLVNGDGVSVFDRKITISKGGIYVLNGKLESGQVVVDVKDDEKVRLILNGVDISSSTNTPIFVKNAKKVIITLAANTENNLSLDGKVTKTEENNDSVIYSNSDLSFNGTGVLNLSSGYGKGIISQDKLVFVDGKYDLDTLDHSVKAKTGLAIADGSYNIKTGEEGDGLKAEHDSDKSLGYIYIDNGKFDISVGDDGIGASSNVTINGGDINISKSTEGIEGEKIDITGGNIKVVSSDDGINASSSNKDSAVNKEDLYIKISGGNVQVNANGDGIDSNGNFFVTGGETFVEGPTDNGNAAVDYDGTGTITGGVFVAVGSDGMAQSFGDSSTQGNILTSFSGKQKGTLKVSDKNGNLIKEFTPVKEYKSVVVSTPDLKQGGSYVLSTDSEKSEITLDKISYGNSRGEFGRPKKNKENERPQDKPH